MNKETAASKKEKKPLHGEIEELDFEVDNLELQLEDTAKIRESHLFFYFFRNIFSFSGYILSSFLALASCVISVTSLVSISKGTFGGHWGIAAESACWITSIIFSTVCYKLTSKHAYTKNKDWANSIKHHFVRAICLISLTSIVIIINDINSLGGFLRSAPVTLVLSGWLIFFAKNFKGTDSLGKHLSNHAHKYTVGLVIKTFDQNTLESQVLPTIQGMIAERKDYSLDSFIKSFLAGLIAATIILVVSAYWDTFLYDLSVKEENDNHYSPGSILGSALYIYIGLALFLPTLGYLVYRTILKWIPILGGSKRNLIKIERAIRAYLDAKEKHKRKSQD